MSTDLRIAASNDEQLRLMIEAMPSGIVVVDQAGQIVMVNGRLEALFGFSRQELIGQPVELLVPERFRDRHLEYRAAFLANPQARPMGAGRELFALRKDGTEFPVEIGLSAINSQAGLFILGTVVDISERRRTDEELKQSQQRVRSIFDSSLDAIVTINEQGRVTEWNPQAERVFGWRADEVIGQAMVDLIVPKRFRDMHNEGLRHFLATGEGPVLNKRLELSAVRRNGEEFLIELTISPIRIGPRWEFSAFVRDITERKEVDKMLRRQRLLLESIHHAQTQFIMAEDPHGIFEEFLSSLVTLTDSEYGFIDEMFYADDGQPYLTARAITDISWNDASRAMHAQFLAGTLNFTNLHSLYGEVMTSGKVVIANDALHDLRRTGIPTGHPPLKAFLGLPLHSNSQEFVGVIGLANRPGGYSEDVATFLEPMVAACANLISARKNDQRRQQAEHELRTTRDELEMRVQLRTAELQAQQQAALRLAQDAEDARKHAARSEERLNLALKSSGIGTWSWNVVEDSIQWDDYIHPIFGLPPGSFSGKYDAFLALVHSDDRERVRREVNQAIEQNADYDTEFQVVWPDGSIHVVGARGKVYRDSAGKPRRMTGVCWDLTQRRLAEEERDRLVSILDATTDFVGLGTPDGRVIYVNQAGRKMVGMDERTPVSATTIADFHPAWAYKMIVDEAIPVVMREGVWSGETALLPRNGSEFPVSQVVLAHKNSSGDIQFISTIMRDISGQKRTEEELKRTARELVRSNTELEQFAYIASHDLQEPLRKVQAFGGMITSKYRDALGEEGRDYLQRMAHAAERMKTLINDLLTFSRITSRAKPFEPVDLNLVLRGVLSDLESRIADTNGRVEADDLATIDADSLQMRQLLQNLIGNGLKFHRPKEPAVVQVNSCLLDNHRGAVLPSSSAEQVCQLTLHDNGIGFEQKYAERIFRPFERLHGRGEYEGTGIGLAVCRKIVERHGGTITAQSEPSKGSTFVVLLPATHHNGEPLP